MSVYVDELRLVAASPRWPFALACHMMADTDAELEAMAISLCLRQEWRHGDHYDLTRRKRAAAIKLGAMAVFTEDLVALRQRARVRTCRVCGCTDFDCRGCIERTGRPCHWVECDLCSACVDDGSK